MSNKYKAVIICMLFVICVAFDSLPLSAENTDDARKFMLRGRTAVNMAKDEAGFLRAAEEFEQAIAADPDLVDAYYNLGVVLDKAGQYDRAIENFNIYLEKAPNASDVKTVRDLIYEIEFCTTCHREIAEGREIIIEGKPYGETCAKRKLHLNGKSESEKPWTEKLNGRWLNGGGEVFDPYHSKTWYNPDNVYEIEVVGDQIQMIIVEFGIINDTYTEARSPQNFLYFSGTIDGNRVKGTDYAWQSRKGSADNDNLRLRMSYDTTKTVALSGDGDTLYWGDMEFRRE